MTRLTVVLIGTMIALAGCDDLPVSSVPEDDPGPAAFAIVDGANPGDLGDLENPLVTANTFFLPPWVDDPVASGDATGTFDPTHRPVFEIWELAEGEVCGVDGGPEDRLVTTLTMDDGPGSETIRVVPEDEHYIANWHTGESEVDPACIYQIRVLTAGVTAATADVQIATSGAGMKNIHTGETVALKDGGSVPVKVRIQEFCDGEEPTCSAGFIDPVLGGSVSLFDPDNGNLVAELDCPAECADRPFVLSLTLLADGPSDDLDPDNQLPYFVEGLTVPDGVLFQNELATFTVCQTVEVQDGREDAELSDASLRLFKVDAGVTDIREDSEGTTAPQCAGFDNGGVISQATGRGRALFAGTPFQPVGTLLRRVATLIGPEPLGATSFFLHGGLNTILRNEEFSDWGATDVAQIEATVLLDGDGVEDVTVDVVAPSEDFDSTAVTDGNGIALFEHLPIAADPYTVSIDETDLPGGVTCASTSEDVLLDDPGATEEVTFECTALGSIAGAVQDGGGTPIVGASVGLEGTTFAALTNTEGQFILLGIPAGTYTLQTSLSGLTCPDQEVTVEAGVEFSATVICGPVLFIDGG